MSEFRQDIVSKHWILFAPNRGKRPEDLRYRTPEPDPKDLEPIVDSCAFCPGNEAYNMEVLAHPKGKDWQVRVIPNKYEALGHSGGRQRVDFYNVREGIGDHEVIITRPHNVPTAYLSDDLMRANLEVYKQRMIDLSQHPEVRYVHILQNFGHSGGATLIHPHSQIYATPFVPEHLEDEVSSGFDYFQQHGTCVFCQMILKEMQDRERIILDHEDFLLLAPFASRVPYAMRIISKRHCARFAEITDKELKSLGEVLKFALQKLHIKLNNPAYNYYIHTLPVSHSLRTRYDVRSYHWHLEILPRINVWGGFELGSDVYVNTVLPEQAADYLRTPNEELKPVVLDATKVLKKKKK